MNLIRIATWVMGTLAVLTLGSLFVGYLLPSTWEARAELDVPASVDEVFPYLDSAAQWAAWTPSAGEGEETFGPDRGVGSGRQWDDPGYGAGRFEITGVDPAREVTYRVEVEGGAIRIEGRIRVEPITLADGASGTRIQWEEDGDFGWNPLLGYLAGRMSELQGEQLAASLESLRSILAGSPITRGADLPD
jgi:uncharacterized protein YndB with AHSA1/START domain